jgi:DNA polymerase-3 subunit gamma/tau
MAARILVPAIDDSERGALARVERLERRIGVDGVEAAPAPAAPAAGRSQPPVAKSTTPAKGAGVDRVAVVEAAPATDVAPAAEVASTEPAATEPAPSTPAQPRAAAAPIGEVSLAQVKDAWPEILEEVKKTRLNAWMVVYTAQPLELRDGKTLVLSFPSQNDVDALKQPASPGQGVGDLLKKAFLTVLGLEPALIARVDAASASSGTRSDTPAAQETAPAADSIEKDAAGWAVTAIPSSEPVASAPKSRPAPKAAPAPKDQSPAEAQDAARYGESVVRELLGASFIEEQPVAPRVVPRAEA